MIEWGMACKTQEEAIESYLRFLHAEDSALKNVPVKIVPSPVGGWYWYAKEGDIDG
jgi:hypothetical protein